MKGACGLMTFSLKADSVDQVENFCESLQHILIAVSWGGHESLIIPRCAGMPGADFDAKNKEHRMLRLCVGSEGADYLINDPERGFISMK